MRRSAGEDDQRADRQPVLDRALPELELLGAGDDVAVYHRDQSP